MIFPVVMYGCELDCEESWAPKNWYFWTVVLEKTLESLLDCKEIQPVHSEGDQSWVFFGRTDTEAETPILWSPHAKGWLIGKDSDAGRDWGQEEKGTTEDEMAGWHHQLDGHEFEWTPGIGDGQGGLAFHDSWGCNESDTIEWLNWTELYHILNNSKNTRGANEAPFWSEYCQAATWVIMRDAVVQMKALTLKVELIWMLNWFRASSPSSISKLTT